MSQFKTVLMADGVPVVNEHAIVQGLCKGISLSKLQISMVFSN